MYTSLLVSFLGACGGPADPLAEPCGVTIVSTDPVDGETNADYRAPVTFHLSGADATATAASDTIAGTSRLADGDTTVIFTPDTPLDPEASHVVNLATCAGTASLAFATSRGGPSGEEELTGNAYTIELSSARAVEPAGFGYVLTDAFGVTLVGVTATSDTSIGLLVAPAAWDVDPPEQDFCGATQAFDASYEALFFSASAATLTMPLEVGSATLLDATLSGSFSFDGTYFSGGALSGTADLRALVAALEQPDADALCGLVAAFGGSCAACPTDGEPYCVGLVFDQITAERVDSATLVEVAGSECDGCADGPPADDAVCAE